MDIKVKQLNESYLDELLEFQEEVYKEDNSEKILHSPKNILISYFKEKGFILGLFDGDALVGFSRIWYPEITEVSEAYKEILKLDKDKIKTTAFLRGTCVKKEYRGNKLQKKLYENAISILTYLNFRYITAKVKMRNLTSIKKFSELGFKNEGIIIKDDEEYFLLIKSL